MRSGKLNPVNNAKLNFPGYQEIFDYTIPSIDTYTKLLLHANNVNGSQVFIDETNKTVTPNGNVNTSTATKKFGSTSAYFDGFGDYLGLNYSADWDFGSGDFTIDFWINFSSLQNSALCTHDSSTELGGAFELHWYTNNKLSFYTVGSTGYQISLQGDFTPVIGTWYHIAVVRNGNNFNLYIDGISITSTSSSYSISSGGSRPLYIGCQRIYSDTYRYFLNGYIDEFRISKGIARWTSNFNVPTSEYQDSFAEINLAVDGNIDKEYKICIFYPDSSTYYYPRIRLNNDTGSNYGLQRLLNDNTVIAGYRGTTTNMLNGWFRGYYEATLFTPQGFPKFLKHQLASYEYGVTSGTALRYSGICGFVWNNTANVTNLNFSSGVGLLPVGTRIVVFVRRSN